MWTDGRLLQDAGGRLWKNLGEKLFFQGSWYYCAFHNQVCIQKKKLSGIKLGKRGPQNHFLTAAAKAAP